MFALGLLGDKVWGLSQDSCAGDRVWGAIRALGSFE